MSIYRIEHTVLSSDTDANRRLRLSRLFTMLQEASIAHTTALGMGREKTLDRGLLWIVTLQQAKIARLPEYDETIRLRSWPGKMLHLLFPRHYRIEDQAGNALVEANALWALMDEQTRRVVFPERVGVKIRGVHTGKELPLPAVPRVPTAGETHAVTVPYSFVDLNGHMNNTRYFDLAEDSMPQTLRSKRIVSIRAEYSREACLGDTITLCGEAQGNTFLLSGDCAGQRVFKLNLDYSDR